MEKGEIRFEGPAGELAERDDLARAVFLGALTRALARRRLLAVDFPKQVVFTGAMTGLTTA